LEETKSQLGQKHEKESKKIKNENIENRKIK
jgi:hypothetical protein